MKETPRGEKRKREKKKKKRRFHVGKKKESHRQTYAQSRNTDDQSNARGHIIRKGGWGGEVLTFAINA